MVEMNTGTMIKMIIGKMIETIIGTIPSACSDSLVEEEEFGAYTNSNGIHQNSLQTNNSGIDDNDLFVPIQIAME